MGHEGMKSSLPSREVIADSVELTMRGHAYDALVGLAGCDKSLPGMMMAMVPPQRAVDLHLWRLDPARHLQGPAGHRAGRVRGGRQAFGRRRCRTRTSTSSSRSPARRPAPAARSSPPTPWRPCPRRSAWRCPIRPARRRPTKSATRFCMTAGEQVMELIAKQHPPARHRHPQGAGKRRRRRRRLRRLDQCGAASAGDRARMRHRVRPVRRRRDLQEARPISPT